MSDNQNKPSRFTYSALDLIPVVGTLAYFEDDLIAAELWSGTTLKVIVIMVAATVAFAIGRLCFRAIKSIVVNRK
jgi:hypothetical protein